MKEIRGNLFSIKCDAICCTTNNILKKDGSLTMGAGIALEFNRRVPGLSYYFGAVLKAHDMKNVPILCQLGVNIAFPQGEWHTMNVVSFPTKNHWRDDSSLLLIQKSARLLVRMADHYGWKSICLPRPGCGRGGLLFENVKPTISEILDDRFYVVTYGGN